MKTIVAIACLAAAAHANDVPCASLKKEACSDAIECFYQDSMCKVMETCNDISFDRAQCEHHNICHWHPGSKTCITPDSCGLANTDEESCDAAAGCFWNRISGITGVQHCAVRTSCAIISNDVSMCNRQSGCYYDRAWRLCRDNTDVYTPDNVGGVGWYSGDPCAPLSKKECKADTNCDYSNIHQRTETCTSRPITERINHPKDIVSVACGDIFNKRECKGAATAGNSCVWNECHTVGVGYSYCQDSNVDVPEANTCNVAAWSYGARVTQETDSRYIGGSYDYDWNHGPIAEFIEDDQGSKPLFLSDDFHVDLAVAERFPCMFASPGAILCEEDNLFEDDYNNDGDIGNMRTVNIGWARPDKTSLSSSAGAGSESSDNSLWNDPNGRTDADRDEDGWYQIVIDLGRVSDFNTAYLFVPCLQWDKTPEGSGPYWKDNGYHDRKYYGENMEEDYNDPDLVDFALNQKALHACGKSGHMDGEKGPTTYFRFAEAKSDLDYNDAGWKVICDTVFVPGNLGVAPMRFELPRLVHTRHVRYSSLNTVYAGAYGYLDYAEDPTRHNYGGYWMTGLASLKLFNEPRQTGADRYYQPNVGRTARFPHSFTLGK